MNRPKAKKILKHLEIHNDTRIDPYFWLNEKQNPEVIEYLNAENDYLNHEMKDTETLQESLFEEMKSRYKKNDESLPYFFNQYWHIVKYKENQEYPFFYRKFKSLESEEELILDTNLLAKNQDFFEIGSLSTSMDNQILAYSQDTLGRRKFDIFFKNLKTGQTLPYHIPNTSGKIVWANDNEHIFYIKKNKVLRSDKIFRHKIGTDPKEDVLIFHEKNTAFDLNLYKSKSLKYIFISSSSSISDEHWFIPAENIFEKWRVVQPRKKNIEYAVEHYQDDFYIITNAQNSTNFKIVKTPVATPEMKFWQDFIPHQEEILLEGFEIFENFFVIEQRNQGLLELKIIDTKSQETHFLPFKEPTYTAYIGYNLEFNTEKLRYGYSSLTTPTSTIEYDMRTKNETILKEQEILGGKFEKKNYISERIWVKSRDGKNSIPVSLVYHKNTKKSSETPLLLYGYGSYGHTVDAGFSSVRLSLLDRGFIYAIAHIRGGEYLGRKWYEDGKLMQKKNSFFDFIDVAQHLILENYTSSKHIYAMGGSAGGLLVGAVMNMEPDLFNGVIAQVPFVDVVTTMLDENIPLTTGEYDEWGNPNDEEFYHYMKSYSPYDNVSAKNYPHLLVSTGLHDSQVQYWEPAKWVAKLRELKTDNHLLLLKTDMNSGHGGASGRFEGLKEEALEYAFLLKLENILK